MVVIAVEGSDNERMNEQRKVIPTESPRGEVITEDCGEDGSRHIRLWSKNFDYVGRWCFTCKHWHIAPGTDVVL